jgi:hypothetical protein
VAVKEIENGYVYQFPARNDQIIELAHLIELEHLAVRS